MHKIMSVFQRNYTPDHLVGNAVMPGAEWVLNGEGISTRKFDGTCCMMLDGKLHKRYELKSGRQAPPDFLPARDPDAVTGDVPGWLPVGEGPEDRWYRDGLALHMQAGVIIPDGTYELIGPHIKGDPERMGYHCLMAHGADILPDAPRDFDGLRAYLAGHDIEGIVWHHPDGRMAQLTKRDFGFKR